MSITAMIPLIILIGLLSSILASLMGLGGGLVAIPLLLIVVGGGNNLPAKIMAYSSIVLLSIFGAIKYFRLKMKPDWKSAGFILIGTLPFTIIAEHFIGPLLDTKEMAPYFHFLYVAVIIFVVILINLKDKIKIKRLKPVVLPLFGAVIGLMSGTFGLSGGVLYVPLLVVGLGMNLKSAAVTSLVLKMPTALANIITAGASGQFSSFEANGLAWYLPLIILIGSLIGSQIGPLLNKRMNGKQMTLVFNVVMSVLMVWELIYGSLMLAEIPLFV